MNPLFESPVAGARRPRRVTQLCDRALAPLDLRATQLSMLREIDRRAPPGTVEAVTKEVVSGKGFAETAEVDAADAQFGEVT